MPRTPAKQYRMPESILGKLDDLAPMYGNASHARLLQIAVAELHARHFGPPIRVAKKPHPNPTKSTDCP